MPAFVLLEKPVPSNVKQPTVLMVPPKCLWQREGKLGSGGGRGGGSSAPGLWQRLPKLSVHTAKK